MIMLKRATKLPISLTENVYLQPLTKRGRNKKIQKE